MSRKNLMMLVALLAATTNPAAAQVKIGVLSDMNSLYADITGKGTGVAAHLAAEDFGPVLGKPVKRRDIVEMLDAIEDENGPVMADRVLAHVRKAFFARRRVQPVTIAVLLFSGLGQRGWIENGPAVNPANLPLLAKDVIDRLCPSIRLDLAIG